MSELDIKIQAMIAKDGRGGKPAHEVLELMVVDYLKEKAAGRATISITDGETTYTCVAHNPAKEQSKKPRRL